MEHTLWSCVMAVLTILYAIYFKRNKKKQRYIYLLACLLGGILCILSIFNDTFDSYSSIYVGISCICYTYYDNKKNPVSKMTTAHASSLQGYVGGVGLILYGVLTLFVSD